MTDDTRALFEALDRTVNGVTIRFTDDEPLTLSSLFQEILKRGEPKEVWLHIRDWNRLWERVSPSARYGSQANGGNAIHFVNSVVLWFSD